MSIGHPRTSAGSTVSRVVEVSDPRCQRSGGREIVDPRGTGAFLERSAPLPVGRLRWKSTMTDFDQHMSSPSPGTFWVRLLLCIAFVAPVGYVASIFAVAVHEILGHGCTAWLVGGSFTGFALLPDAMGWAVVSSSRYENAVLGAGVVAGMHDAGRLRRRHRTALGHGAPQRVPHHSGEKSTLGVGAGLVARRNLDGKRRRRWPAALGPGPPLSGAHTPKE